MLKFLKDDDEVLFEEVTRLARRSIRILEDLSEFSAASSWANTLRQRALRRSELLTELSQALRAHGDVPADEDPERAHMQALWYRLKSAVSEEDQEAVLQQALKEQDAELRRAIDAARKHAPGPEVENALDALADQTALEPPTD